MTFDLTDEYKMVIHEKRTEPWKVTVVDTGLDTMTGCRVKRIEKYIGNEPFMLTYGDGVCDVDISSLLKFHQEHGKIATLTSVTLKQEKGILDIDEDNTVHSFREKHKGDGTPINAGFMVLNPQVFDYLSGDESSFEKEALGRLAQEGELMSFNHDGFWQCMDTKQQMLELERRIKNNDAPWMVWKRDNN